jgi:hypothetical protein
MANVWRGSKIFGKRIPSFPATAQHYCPESNPNQTENLFLSPQPSPIAMKLSLLSAYISFIPAWEGETRLLYEVGRSQRI